MAVGEGVMPVPGIFEALMEIKYPGTVDLGRDRSPGPDAGRGGELCLHARGADGDGLQVRRADRVKTNTEILDARRARSRMTAIRACVAGS